MQVQQTIYLWALVVAVGGAINAIAGQAKGYVQPKQFRTYTKTDIKELAARESNDEALATPDVITPIVATDLHHDRPVTVSNHETMVPARWLKQPPRTSKGDCERQLRNALLRLEMIRQRLALQNQVDLTDESHLGNQLKTVEYYRSSTREALDRLEGQNDNTFRKHRSELKLFIDDLNRYLNGKQENT